MRLMLSGAILLLAGIMLPAATFGALREPQVSVSGTALQTFFDQLDEHIRVDSDQDARQTYLPRKSESGWYEVAFELAANTGEFELGFYNAGDENPVLYPLFPPNWYAGWFVVASFRNAPARAIITLYDESGAAAGVRTYPGARSDTLGLYMKGPERTLFTQDIRNPASSPQALFFANTTGEPDAGWFAWEELPRDGGGDADFDDAIVHVGRSAGACGPQCVPTRAGTWGQLKAFYR